MSARRAGFREAAPPPSSRTQRGGRDLYTLILRLLTAGCGAFFPCRPRQPMSEVGGENGLNTDMPPLAESNPLRTSAVNEDAP
jgi:hypothetical protein